MQLPSPEPSSKADADMPRLEILSRGSKYGIIELYSKLYISEILAECEDEPASPLEYDATARKGGTATDASQRSGELDGGAKPPSTASAPPPAMTPATASAHATRPGEADSLDDSNNDEEFHVPSGGGQQRGPFEAAEWSEWNTSLFSFNAMDLDLMNLDGLELPAIEAILHPYQCDSNPNPQGEQW